MILPSLALRSQSKCKDAVHPTDNRKSILNCCIRDIKENNVVVYAINGEVYSINAVAISLNETYYDLTNPDDLTNLTSVILRNKSPYGYLGEEYEYFRNMRSKASMNVTLGSAMIVLGAGMFVAGVITVNNKLENYSSSSNNYNGQGLFLMLIGAGGIGAGIPITAVNAKKASRNKKEMERIEHQAILSLQTTPYGLGLVLNF